jgi:hypothetical protein
MKIQSLSLVVPARKCINNCRFCVAGMVEEDYENMWSKDNLYWHLYEEDFIKRLEFARDNGCNTIMLTGNCEPQQNREFLKDFGTINKKILTQPFRIIEMQTTGATIDDSYLYFLRHHVGVNTISLSMSAFDNAVNRNYNNTKEDWTVDIKYLCSRIKQYRFNLRLSLNMTDAYNDWNAARIFTYAQEELLADQITFRVLYDSGLGTEQDRWIKEHRCRETLVDEIRTFIKANGNPLERLEFGSLKYSVNGMSVVLDEDCMSVEAKESLKYLILRPDCKLYSKWDDKGSLIF